MRRAKRTSRVARLIGKPIMMKHRFEPDAEGPYVFLGIDSGFFGVLSDRGEFWFNCTVIESFKEVKQREKQ